MMTDEERRYLFENYIRVEFKCNHIAEIRRTFGRKFSRMFTEAEINAEKLELYRKIRNGEDFISAAENDQQCVEPIGHAIGKAVSYIVANPNPKRNPLLVHQLHEMMKLFLAMQCDVGLFIPFDQFQSLVCKKLGFDSIRKRWFLGFVEGTGRKYNQNDHTKWRKTNEVPSEVLGDLENMDVAAAINAATKLSIEWTDAMKQKLASYTRWSEASYRPVKNHTYQSIADALSEEFGIHITDGMVKRQVANLTKTRDKKTNDFIAGMISKYDELSTT